MAFVMRTQKTHYEKCKAFNSQYEHVRVHVYGVFLSKEKALEEAKARSSNSCKCFVQGYKIKDWPQPIQRCGWSEDMKGSINA